MKRRSQSRMVAVILLLLIATSTACNGGANLDVTVQSDNQTISVLEENEQTFTSLLAGKDLEEIPYVQLGADVIVSSSGTFPRSVQVEDILLNLDGSPKFKEEMDIVVDHVYEGDEISFELKMHPAIFFSSNSEDYLPGRVVHGFRLTYEVDNQEVSYVFVLRTDAGSPESLLNK